MRGRAPLNLAGQKFGELTTVKIIGRSVAGRVLWSCMCSCGSTSVVSTGDLRSGGTRSCGCSKTKFINETRVAHGEARRSFKSPEYRTWSGMLSRCSNPNVQGYKNYGGRGIKVCKRWLKFENFLADMGRRPSPKHTIEREDNDLGYTPKNCTWLHHSKQSGNRRTNHRLVHSGLSMTITEWAKKLGLTQNLISNRLFRGWSVERALTTPAIPSKFTG